MWRTIKHTIWIAACLIVLSGCDGRNNNTSVPSSPVRLAFDLRARFATFYPPVYCSYVTVDKNGYHYGKDTYLLSMGDYYGFAGVVVFVTQGNTYAAMDLGCPHCLSKEQHCEVDGFYAKCPICREEYDLSLGIGNPTRGVSKEYLRRYEARLDAGGMVLRISN